MVIHHKSAKQSTDKITQKNPVYANKYQTQIHEIFIGIKKKKKEKKTE